MALSPPSFSTPDLTPGPQGEGRTALVPIKEGEHEQVRNVQERAFKLGLIPGPAELPSGLEIAKDPRITLWNGDEQKTVSYFGDPNKLNKWIKDNHPGWTQGPPFYNLPFVKGI